jgi:hypothetical protein
MSKQLLPLWEPPENPRHPLFDEPPIIYPPMPRQNRGNTKRKSPVFPELVAELKDLYYREGKSPTELGRMFGISRITIGRYIGIYSYDDESQFTSKSADNNDLSPEPNNNDALHRESDWPLGQSAQDESRDESAQRHD